MNTQSEGLGTNLGSENSEVVFADIHELALIAIQLNHQPEIFFQFNISFQNYYLAIDEFQTF